MVERARPARRPLGSDAEQPAPPVSKGKSRARKASLAAEPSVHGISTLLFTPDQPADLPEATPATRLFGHVPAYDPDLCERVVELGRQGMSRAEIASALGCSRRLLADWQAAHPDFHDAMTRAKDEELAWWEAQGREGLEKGSKFNTTLWAKSAAGGFPAEPYRDRAAGAREDEPLQVVIGGADADL